MHAALMRRFLVVFLILTCAVILAISTKISAQTTDCSLVPGSHSATAADVIQMKAAGITGAVVGMCWNPSDPNAGQSVGEAKLWLQRHATKNANISCLSATFAERLKNLMEEVPGGPPTISDGYRSPQEQANLPKGSTRVGPCGSYHQYGLAADFNVDTSAQTLQWMRVNASRLGLSPVTNANPVTGCTPRGFCDSGHIQIAGPRPPVNQCGICSSTGGNGTLPSVPTSPYPDDLYNFYNAPPQTPSSLLSNMLRSFLNPSTTAIPVQQPTQTYQQSLPQTQQPFDYTQPQTTQTQGITASSTSGGSGSGTNSSSVGGGGINGTGNSQAVHIQPSSGSEAGNSLGALAYMPTSSNYLYIDQNTNAGGGGLSALDMLLQIAYPSSTNSAASAVSTSGPAALNANVRNATNTASSAQQNQNTRATGTVAYSSGTPAQTYVAEQTFTSNDLRNRGSANSTYSPQQLPTFQRILTQLRDVLILMLHYLQPFGGNVPR